MERIKGKFKPHVIEAFNLFCKGLSAQGIADKLNLALNTAHVYKKRVQNALYKEIVILDRNLS